MLGPVSKDYGYNAERNTELYQLVSYATTEEIHNREVCVW